MTVTGIILLVAILLAVIALVAVAVVATLGLDADQARLKKSLRWAGAVLCITAGFLDHWSYVLLGAACLVLSLPQVNLPRFAQRVDKSLEPRR